eukprot:CAMPEP_0119350148 /NCGR_PEP_ID=MMETSP1333-20130426/109912_1 /TAXON_ID=418940 /ORGANISM="Scyphosphaera apsteinii, Strain RCC1455" /LENGTH=222 /DNA_ID=CAMNT_0007362761 /DNA_START=633 /DNA_END=1298 /DNA_ORIENTATION=-
MRACVLTEHKENQTDVLCSDVQKKLTFPNSPPIRVRKLQSEQQLRGLGSKSYAMFYSQDRLDRIKVKGTRCPGCSPPPGTIYVQGVEDLAARGLYVILQDYQPLFGLSDSQVKLVHSHMKYWQIIRQCCGSQQSIDSRIILHNSTVRPTHAPDSYDQPSCQIYNLEQVEIAFLQTELSRKFPDALFPGGGRVPGDPLIVTQGYCATTNAKIVKGYDFNGRNW